jgi:flagellin
MGLRINTNIASQEVQRNLRTNTEGQEVEFAKLSSGKRITKAADDAAGMAIAKKLESTNRSLNVAKRNASNAISLVQVAEGGLNESTNILTRLRELSIQAASDNIGEVERGFLDLEYQQLNSELDRVANTTEFSGMKLLKGDSSNGTMEFHVGATADQMNKISFDASYANATVENLGVDGTHIRDKEDAADNLEKIDEAINKVVSFRANFGSIQSRLQYTVTNIETASLNQEAARSRIEDVDVAESTAKIASVNIMKAAGISTLAQANDIPLNALKLIG